jgi:lactoylglutathione lyase
MKIHHIAIWTRDIENMKNFYVRYFDCKHSEKYINHKKSFESYFLDFGGETKLELMSMPFIPENNNTSGQYMGIIHYAISVGSRDIVIEITGKLKKDGFKVISDPRETGDGYYESCVLDPEGNRIEITV